MKLKDRIKINKTTYLKQKLKFYASLGAGKQRERLNMKKLNEAFQY